MRIASWNVNGIRAAASKGLFDWLAIESPDILCVQETKADPGILEENYHTPLDKNGIPYQSWWSSAKKKGYSGVALYSKLKPLNVYNLGIPEFDDEGRMLAADFGFFVLISAYFPNSQENGIRLGYKLDFCNAIYKLCDKIIQSGKHIILSGDFNIAHKPIDLARPKENEGNPGYLPEERSWMDNFIGSGYIDTFRYFCKEPGQYSWWSYRMKAREKNIGWRLDYHCIDPGLKDILISSSIEKNVTGSDHCPVILELMSDSISI